MSILTERPADPGFTEEHLVEGRRVRLSVREHADLPFWEIRLTGDFVVDAMSGESAPEALRQARLLFAKVFPEHVCGARCRLAPDPTEALPISA